jgi:4-hydroxy-2-oxoglutarate aldolase
MTDPAPPQTLSLSGIFPPIPTPFDRHGDVDYQALRVNLSLWNQYDLAGYAVLGSNGETVHLTLEEKVRILEKAREAIPVGTLLMAGTGCESTRATISLTRQAADVGADVALLITPHFYDGKMTPSALVHHFHAVADASPIPTVLYNVPKFTHVDMAATTIALAGAHPNVIGIKDSGGNITKIADTVRLADPGFQVLAGSAGFLFAALAVGAVGGVLALANVGPRQCINIWRLFQAGQWDEAAELQRRMVPVNTAITARYGIAGLKAALDMLGYTGGPVRAPLLDLAEAERQVIQEVLSTGGLL